MKSREQNRDTITNRINLAIDNPIYLPNEDQLDYFPVAQMLCGTIRNLPIGKHCSIGLIAPWGTGKTSFLNLLKHYLASKEYLILDFNPRHSKTSSLIQEDFFNLLAGELEESEYRFTISNTDIDRDSLSLNPIHYLPKYNDALEKVLEMRERDDFEVVPLSSIADIYNGPRFKRPYADNGVTSGEGIRKYFTGTAMTQLNSDNVKYLDEKKCTKTQKAQLDFLTIYKGYILVSDSGTLGRVSYALNQHDGHIATNNLIRIVIEDENLRGYVFQYLKSEIGQSLMLKNSYGTNQEHLEPENIKDVLIPLPKDRSIVDKIGATVIKSINDLERSIENNNKADKMFDELYGI